MIEITEKTVQEFAIWLVSKSKTWYEQQNTNYHPYKKLWSIYCAEQTKQHSYNRFKQYYHQIVAVISKQLNVWNHYPTSTKNRCIGCNAVILHQNFYCETCSQAIDQKAQQIKQSRENYGT